jgi:hypothetical protein
MRVESRRLASIKKLRVKRKKGKNNNKTFARNNEQES